MPLNVVRLENAHPPIAITFVPEPSLEIQLAAVGFQLAEKQS